VIEQPLLKGARRSVNIWSIENTKVSNEIEELLLKQAIEQVIYAVIVHYHALHLSEQNVELQQRWTQQSQRFYDNQKARVELGRAPQSDLIPTQLQVNQAQSYLAAAHFESRQAKRKLLELIGSEIDQGNSQEINFAKETMIEKQEIRDYLDKSQLIQTVSNNDIETKIIKLNQERLQKQLIVAKDQQLIDVKLRGDWTIGRYHVYGENQLTPVLNDDIMYNYPFVHQNGNYSAQLLVSIPLTGKDERHHQALATKMALKKLAIEEQFHRQQLDNYIQSLLEQVTLKKQQATLALESVMLAQKNYDDAVMKQEAGRTSMFEVVALGERLQDAQLNYNTNQIAYLDILANIDLSAGLLCEKWLG
jgi:outer membrane protein TolC